MPGRCPSSVTCGDTLRGEGDVMTLAANTQPRDFNPRPPRGGRHVSRISSDKTQRFQSTSSARRTTVSCLCISPNMHISIHVLREEDDCNLPRNPPTTTRFQSTSSARRTTQLFPVQAKALPISIHVLREEDDSLGDIVTCNVLISIHVLREEDDDSFNSTRQNLPKFQSTSSARRTTHCNGDNLFD